MTPEDEEFNRVEMESRIKQEYVRDIKIPTREQLIAEVAVLTELVRVLSDRVVELEGKHETDPRVFGRVSHVYGDHPISFGLPQQRTWVGLTDEEIQAEWLLTPQHDKAEGLWFGRRLEAKLKEKNT